MKLFNILLVASIILGGTTLSAQNYILAFKNQDFSVIESNLTADVTVKVDSAKKLKGKAAGLQAIKSVLTDFAPISAESKHKGGSENNDNDYLIAKLENASGEKMRVFIHLENSENGKRICDVKIRRS